MPTGDLAEGLIDLVGARERIDNLPDDRAAAAFAAACALAHIYQVTTRKPDGH